MNLDYSPAPVDALPRKNRAGGGKAPNGTRYRSKRRQAQPVAEIAPEKPCGAINDALAMPFREYVDGIKRKGMSMGGCPRPLIRI